MLLIESDAMPDTAPRVELTKQQWIAELISAITAAGLTWRVSKALVEDGTPMCYAAVTDPDRLQQCQVTIARDRFSTPDARRDEILRQLVNPRR